LLAVMVPVGVRLGPAMLPALLLVGAAAMIAGGRACGSVIRDERFHATGVLLSAMCQVVAGVALVASGEPLWNQVGLAVAMGAVLAAGAGLFVAPGMMRLFGGEVPGEPERSAAAAQQSAAPAERSPASEQRSSAPAQQSPAPAQQSPAPAQQSSAEAPAEASAEAPAKAPAEAPAKAPAKDDDA
jgi:uncharacterized membrane protein YedE/YeeE